ncbi:CPSF A subunit region-domain-containing protein [Phycomyces blakesleeanus]
MSVYAIYQELFPPQTVEHAERAHLTSPDAINLVVAKASLLQVYAFVEYTPESTLDDEDADQGINLSDSDKEIENERSNGDEEQTLVYPKLKLLKKSPLDTTKGRLELVAQYKLNGSVSAMGVVRTSSARGKAGCDSLLLGFNDAKMSLLEWSPETHSIVTVSIHYYERDEMKKEFLTNPYPPAIHVDPQQRCALLNFYDNKLAVLPFCQSDNLDTSASNPGDQEDEDHAQKWPYSPSFVIELEKIDPRIRNVIDMTFLSGYYEPTLAILFQPEQTWTGRLATTKDTVSIVVISLDLSAKAYPIIYSLDNLPYDCRSLVALPKPVDGLLVIASNALLHVSQGSPGVGVAVNGYTNKTTEFPGMIYDDALIEQGLMLDGAKALSMGGNKCLLFLQNGDWVGVQMKMDGNKVVGVSMDTIHHPPVLGPQDSGDGHTPVACIPTCISSIKDGEFFFLGSRVGDSLLIKWKNGSEPGSKPVSPEIDWTFRVCDALLNTGPIVDMTVGDMESKDASDDMIEKSTDFPDLELVSCSGYGKNGALCVFQRHVRPETTFSFTQSDCQAVWSIKCRKEHFFEGVQVGGGVQLTQTGLTPEEGTGHWGTVASDDGFKDAFDKFLFISKTESTLVLAAGDELCELESSDFHTTGPTIAVSTLFDHTRIVQIHSHGVVLLSPDGKLVQTVPVKDSKIVDASIHDPYILLTLENQTILALKGDAETRDIIYVQVPASIKNKDVLVASVFADTSGIFASVSEKLATVVKKSRPAGHEKKRKASEAFGTTNTNNNGATTTTATTANANTTTTKKANIAPPAPPTVEFDEIDMDLYGDQSEGEPVKTTVTIAEDEIMTDSTTQIGQQGQNEDDDDEDDDDDEAMLYGDSEPIKKYPGLFNEEVDEVNVSVKGGLGQIEMISFWCLIYTVEGNLQLHSLPDFKEYFVFPHFDVLPSLLTDCPGHEQEQVPPHLPAHQDNGSLSIKELIITDIGKERKDPHLVARTSTNDIIIYKAFAFVPGLDSQSDHTTQITEEAGDRLAIRFSRVHHEYVSRYTEEDNDNSNNNSKKYSKKNKNSTGAAADDDDDEDDEEESDGPEIKKDDHVMGTDPFGSGLKESKVIKPRRQRLLIPFNDVAGYAGVFVAGPQPAWLMCSCKSFVRVHPMKADQAVIGFTQFHNVNLKHGFITIDAESTVRLCGLPVDNATYDMDWVMQRIPLGQTAHKIQYDPTMRVYAVLVSTPQPVRLRNEEGAPVDGKEEEGREPGEFLPLVDRFSLLMVSPVTWETVDRIEFEEYEQGFSLQCVALESKQTSTGRKHFMTVGTGFLRGEDTAMRGSIYIFDIIEVVPEPNNPQTNHRYKHLHTEDVKGAVTAMCDVSGHLVSCIGSKVIIWSFEDNESLVGVAFIDVQIYVTSLCSIKNFILLGDAQKSIWFLGFQLEPAKLVLLGKDYQAFEVASVNFIIDDKSLFLLVGDTDDNLDIYQYAPFNLQSFTGHKLMRRGDFHVGAQVKTMVRLPQIVRTEKGLEYSRRHFCLCGSFSGSISVVSPIPEKTFKRLNTLYGQLVNGIQHVAGLNPRAFRLIKGPKQKMASNRTKAILDGDLVFEFAGLSVSQQKEMTKQIGTTVAKIKEDLVDVDSSIDHF